MGSESLNWRSAEPEMPSAECNTEAVNRSQTLDPPQVTVSAGALGSSKVESVADHQDYVAFLRTGKKNLYSIIVYS